TESLREERPTMTTSITKHVRSTTGTILVVAALASAIGGVFAAPALGQDRGWRQEQQERGRHERHWRDDRGRRAYRPVYVAPPVVYAPPPVVYVPAPSVGVRLFFPLFR